MILEKDYDYTSFFSSLISIVTVFIVSHFSHLAPKSDILIMSHLNNKQAKLETLQTRIHE
jgi:hypothetical protein